MKEIDEKVLEIFLSDLNSLHMVVRNTELCQLDICPGIEQIVSLTDDLQDDILLLDEDAHEEFILERNKISLVNMQAKKERLAGIKPAKDVIDERTIKRLILTQYDLNKYKKVLTLITRIAKENGWLK